MVGVSKFGWKIAKHEVFCCKTDDEFMVSQSLSIRVVAHGGSILGNNRGDKNVASMRLKVLDYSLGYAVV